ncbi:F-box/WD repeat-containing protein 9, partial [Ceratobasidium sp. 423]
TPPAMTDSLRGLCRAIQTELRGAYGTQDRNLISRYLQAEHDLDKITGCYHRIQGHLERVMFNASLNILGIVDKQATEAQLGKLNMSTSARYDSADAHVVQRRECTPNTREQVLLDLHAWKDKLDGEKVCWINGMAGTGKTTIVNTLCSTLDKNHELGASFFCSRSLPECRNVKFILPTVAYQLARFSSPFRYALLEVLDRDPDVHTKVLHVQFKRMILEPLRQVVCSLPTNVTVVIDALDECADGNGVEHILDVLLDNALELPIKFLVSSRPEYHIREKIGKSAQKLQLTLHELEEGMVKADIETYMRAELASISTHLSENQLEVLVEHAGALFIYAATVVRYLRSGDSLSRLNAVLKTPSAGRESSNKSKEIDRLYGAVLISALENEDLEQSEKEEMELVLHTVVCAQEPLTVGALAGLLSLGRTQVTAALKPLWSVLHVSESDTNPRVGTLHASFPDYILDSNRSKQFACNAQLHNRRLAELCFGRISRNEPQFNICNLQSSYVFDEDIPDIDDRVKQNIPLDLLYACQYWAVHLDLGGKSTELAEALHEFLSKRLLLWMEVLNLTKRIDKYVGLMEKAIYWLQVADCAEDTMLLARDARRFVMTFATSPVSRSTPHLYVSMLSSWPDYQPIAEPYMRRTVDLIGFKGIQVTERQVALLSLIRVGSEALCVAYSPNGAFLAAGTWDRRILIWDAVSCRMTIDPIRGHTAPVQAISISPDGTQICSGSHDKTICIWDSQNGQQIAGPLEGHTDWVNSVDYSPDGLWLASGSGDGTVRVWSTDNWQMKGDPLEWRGGPVYSVAFSPDGSIVAAGSESAIHLWDPFTDQTIGQPLKGHTDEIRALAFLPDGKHLISGSRDCTICIWDTSKGQMTVGPFQRHLAGVDDVVVSPDGNLLVSASWDDTIQIWDTKSWETRSLFRHTGIARSVRFSPDGLHLASGSADGDIRIWEVQGLEDSHRVDGHIVEKPLHGHMDWVTSIAFSPCGTYFVSGSNDMTTQIWDTQSGQPISSPLKGDSHPVLRVGISADGNHIFSISYNRMVFVWDRQTGGLEYTIGPIETDGYHHESYQEFWPVAFLFDAKRVVCGSHSGRIYMWGDSELSFELIGHSKAVYSIAFLPDGRSFISGSDDGELIIWDASSGERLLDTFAGHTDRIYSITFSPDGTQFATGSMDTTIRIWNTHNGSAVGDPLLGHTDSALCVAFSPNGTYLASGSFDESIRVWDVASGQSIATFKGHTDQVRSIAFSPDGTRIVSGSSDMTIRLWSAPAPKCPSPHDGSDDFPRDPVNMTAANSAPSWMMDEDGWVYDHERHLLIWVPPDLHRVLLVPQNPTLISSRGCIELDFTEARIGDRWEMCYQPFPPAFDE